ncbi:MAG: right-handed parallel beta-helix repeat-containing protein, partial [Bacteroides sp.]|nr:right-handed parallel beta-helix repeat-containing protein [Bacteroides sp.]
MTVKGLITITLCLTCTLSSGLQPQGTGSLVREYHVTKNGSDENTGTVDKPFLSIQKAANMAQAGNVITVHKGVYRERVNPQHGGSSDDNRIIYQAAKGEKVVIKGSELIKDWKRLKGDLWEVTLPSSFFGDFNPYSDSIFGHWFESKGLTHHTGAVYLNGNWLDEAASMEELGASAGDNPLWFGIVDKQNTSIRAQFPGVNPNKEEVEINVRQTVFFPKEQGLNYITVRGFEMSQAATPWAPPTTEQLGLIGPHWSKGWIIEDNTISHSMCVGISIGLGDVGLSVVGTGVGYTELALFLNENDLWSKDKIGGHIVRNNRVSNCEQAGIVGSFGAAFSLIEGNEISDIHVRERFTGMEMCGIKLHAAIDVVIRNNCVYNTGYRARGIWLDWMGQGAIIRDNLVFNTGAPGLYLEVNHGPILVANNILLS